VNNVLKKSTIDLKYEEFITNIKDYFKNSDESIHKARNEIKIIDFKGAKLVVKAFKVPHLFNRIVYTFFRTTKAKKSYDNSIKISEFVPLAIGFIEFQKSGLLSESYFVSEIFDYDFTIREPILDLEFEDRVKVFEDLAEFTFDLHNDGILHKDYSPGNILIKKSEVGYDFKIVDINRMEFKELSLDERLKNFSQLWAKDDDLKIVIKKYASLVEEDEKYCLDKALYFSQNHKDKKNFKKRLKGKKVVD